jgi:uncharacterized protein YwlG (UPF0340 family)
MAKNAPKKNKKTGKTYPIIVHGSDAVKTKLRRLAKARGVSMAQIVCEFVERAKLSTPKKAKAKNHAPAPMPKPEASAEATA